MKPPVRDLVELRISEDPLVWKQLGFCVENNVVALENCKIVLSKQRVMGWSWTTYPAHHGDMLFMLDGISTNLISTRDETRYPEPQKKVSHTNHARRLSRIVVSTKDMKRTVGMFAGMLEAKPLRPARHGDTEFWYLKKNDLILELVSAKETAIMGVIIECDQMPPFPARPAIQDKSRLISPIKREGLQVALTYKPRANESHL